MAKTVRFFACLSALFLATGLLSAQTPQQFVYQAVARNAANQLIINAQVSVQLSILKETAEGDVLYKESHTPKTNENGLFTVKVGGGSSATGNFDAITWHDGVFYLKSEVDVNNDGTADQTSTQQLISVAYSLYATHSSEGLKEVLSRNNSGDCENLTQIKNIAPPTDKNDAVTKGYLDNIVKEVLEKNAGCKAAKAEIASIKETDKDCGAKRLSVVLGSTSGTISYKWYKDNQVIPGETTEKCDAVVSGTYKVEVTATCDKATPTTHTVSESKSVTASGPKVTITQTGGTMSGNTITADKGATLKLTANMSDAVSYAWSGGSSESSATISANTSTDGSTTTYTVNATDASGCESEASVTVEVKTACPTPVVSANALNLSPNSTWKTTTTGSATVSISGVSATNCSGCQYTYQWKATSGSNSYDRQNQYTFDNILSGSHTDLSGMQKRVDGPTTATSSSCTVNVSSAVGSSSGQYYTYHCYIIATNSCGASSDGKYQRATTETIYNK